MTVFKENKYTLQFIEYWMCLKTVKYHNCMAAADSAVVLLEFDIQWDLARTH